MISDWYTAVEQGPGKVAGIPVKCSYARQQGGLFTVMIILEFVNLDG